MVTLLQKTVQVLKFHFDGSLLIVSRDTNVGLSHFHKLCDSPIIDR